MYNMMGKLSEGSRMANKEVHRLD